MKNLQWSFPLSIMLMFSSFCFAQKNFEGIIKIENTVPQSLNADFTIKGDKAMMQSTTEKGKLILITNEATGKKLTITEKDGKTTVIKKESNKNKYQNLNKKYANQKPAANSDKVKVTRETKKINGYKCFKITAKDKRHKGEAWVTKQMDLRLEELFPSIKMNQRTMPRIAKTLQNAVNGVVLEMTYTDIKSKKVETMKVTVNQQKVEDKAFDISMDNAEVYDGAQVRNLIKNAKGDPAKMKKARELLAQMRIQ